MSGCSCAEFTMLVPGGCTDDMLFWSLRGFPCRRLHGGEIELTISGPCDWLGPDGCQHYDKRPRLCRAFIPAKGDT